MPDSPVAILPEASAGGSPDAPVVILGAASGGGSPSSPVVILGAAGGGGSPSSPVVILGAAGGGGSPDSPVVILGAGSGGSGLLLISGVTGPVEMNGEMEEVEAVNGRRAWESSGSSLSVGAYTVAVSWTGSMWQISLEATGFSYSFLGATEGEEGLEGEDVATPDLVSAWVANDLESGSPELSIGGTASPESILLEGSAGGSPSAPVTILAEATAGGTPDKPAGVLLPTGGWPGRVLDDGEDVSDGPDGVLTDLGR